MVLYACLKKSLLEVNIDFVCDSHANVARFCRHAGRPGRLWGHRGPSWARLGASWRPLGVSLARIESLLAHVGASWGRLGASWGVLGASWGILEAFRDNFHEELRFLIEFCSQLRPPKPKKSLIFIGFISIFEKIAFGSEHRLFTRIWCQIGSILASFWPSWAGLGVYWSVLGASWRVLAASWVVLGPSCAPLGASCRVLGASGRVLGASWRRFGSKNHPQHKPD